jgi:molybdopterin converting factor small subunit
MRVNIIYFGLVRNKIGKKKESFELNDGSSLSDLLKDLSKKYGESIKNIFKYDKENNLDPTFIVTINGILKDPLEGSNIILLEGDKIALMTIIGGG